MVKIGRLPGAQGFAAAEAGRGETVHGADLADMAGGIEARGDARLVTAMEIERGCDVSDAAAGLLLAGAGQGFEIKPPIAGEAKPREVIANPGERREQRLPAP